jgi:ASC-1-like (ASCH) protein
MKIHLDPDIFEQVKNGTKNVEARVNDPKRQQLKVGDELLVLKRPDESESLTVRITKLKYFSNFTELADYYPIERLYSPSFTKEEYLALFPKFYSEEEIAKYGTVAIEFELIKSSATNADR